jgi:tRNA wybutosine-synthesizing protein 2
VTPTSRRGPRRPPVERVRVALAEVAGDRVAALLPAGYQRLGTVLLVRWPEALRPHFPLLAEALRRELGAETVLRVTGPIAGELREPATERLAGHSTETEVVEHGIRWRFDAARIMFAAGNRTERVRAGRLVRPGETVYDLFAGIGYFAIPAARGGAERVYAVDRNPVAIHYLSENVVLNDVEDRIHVVFGDNREVRLTDGSADRVFLGYLPSAVPWVDRALHLLREEGGWLHVHLVVDARDAKGQAEREVAEAIREAGGGVEGALGVREVKPYGPGRTHVVADVRAAIPG